MSGPKISVYSLTGRARKVVVEQFMCEQRGLIYGKQIKSLLSDCTGRERELDNALAVLELLQKRNGGQEERLKEVKSVRSSIDQERKQIQNEFSRHTPRISPKYQITEEALEKKKRELEKIIDINNKALTLKKKTDRAVNAGKGEQKKVQQTITEYLTEDGGDKPGAPGERDLSDLKTRISEDISGIISFDDVDVPEKDVKFEDRKEAIRKCEKEQIRFTESILRYQILCDIAGKKEEKKRTFADPDELEEAIARMERIAVKQKEQAYIADCVDEVMKDMGYDLIGRREVRKRNGRQFKNELYQFGEGTAVNITYSPEGQISMELGGLAREDRIPTTDETAVLTRDMETFCGEFSEFEKRMKAKGVVIGNRVALFPPAAEYASMINVSEYKVETGKQITEMKAAGKRRKTAAARQVLQRSEQ